MNTHDLIDAALAARSADADADGQLAAAQAHKADTASAKTDADKALHDDLAANGQAVTVSADIPPVVTLYAAADPDTYTASVIRVA